MFMDGKPVGAEDAKTLGLVDEVVEGDLRAAAIAYAKQLRCLRQGTASRARHAGDTADRSGAGRAARRSRQDAQGRR